MLPSLTVGSLAAVGVVCSVVSVPSGVVSPARPSVADAIGNALGVGLDNAAVVADRESGCVGTGKTGITEVVLIRGFLVGLTPFAS